MSEGAKKCNRCALQDALKGRNICRSCYNEAVRDKKRIRIRYPPSGPAETHDLYSTWEAMRGRCLTPSANAYSYYGGRGITIDPMWDHFWTFVFDMGPRPSPMHSLDRIDGNGPYAPWNCRWATKKEQIHNSCRSHLLTYQGITDSMTGWAKRVNMTQSYFRICAKKIGYLELVTLKFNGRPAGSTEQPA